MSSVPTAIKGHMSIRLRFVISIFGTSRGIKKKERGGLFQNDFRECLTRHDFLAHVANNLARHLRVTAFNRNVASPCATS